MIIKKLTITITKMILITRISLITNNTIKNMLRYKTETRPGLVALIVRHPARKRPERPGPLYLQPPSPHGGS